MAHKVIKEFIDSEDKTHYKVGDAFPKGDTKPTKKRIEELSNVHPRYKVAFIQEKEKKKTSNKE